MLTLILSLMLAANPCAKNLDEPIDAEWILSFNAVLLEDNLLTLQLDVWGNILSKWDVVIVGDGFTDSVEDRELFLSKANEVMENLGAWTPYRRCAFNVYKVFVTSNHQGVDHPLASPPICRDTALNTSFGYIFSDGTYDERYLYTPTPDRCEKAAEVATDNYDMVITLSRDKETRGGLSWLEYPVVTVSIGPGMHEVAPHEVGHQVAYLHDEYGGSTSSYPDGDPEEPNVTIETNRDEIKWNEFIKSTTPLPTTWINAPGTPPEKEQVVGLWEGGAYYDHGIYRPQHNCLMREADTPFCQVCEFWVGKAMAFRCKEDFFVITPPVPYERLAELVCMDDYLIRIPLPPCLPCLHPDIPDSGWVDTGTDTIRIEIGPFPSGTTLFVTDDLGQAVATGFPTVGDTLIATFEAEPFANYFVDIKPIHCPSDLLPVETRLFVDNRPASFP